MPDSQSSYWFIIFFSSTVILSYIFNLIARKTRVPAVLMLIITGIVAKESLSYYGIAGNFNLLPALEILGIIGLIMIVLEAAVDLKLTREKWPIIWKSFVTALIVLLLTSYVVAYIISYFLDISVYIALVYAIPLSIMSSSIIITSVFQLASNKKEFMIYESTFSDILGIIIFYLLLDLLNTQDHMEVFKTSAMNIGFTAAIAVIFTMLIVVLFQKVLSHINYFLIFALLILIFAIGKLFHLSSLIVILVFGVIINNKDLFFIGFLKKAINPGTYERILENFKLFTSQTAFLVRTFFFVIFGMSIVLSSLTNPQVYTITVLILIALYFVRFMNLTLLFQSRIFPELFISPRGLITILLFFSIPEKYLIENLHIDLIFLVIIGTNLIMMGALLFSSSSGEEIDRYDEYT